jgi:hypothetical protein
MLTIFAIPKAFKGHIGIIQRNAIRSWIQLKPRPRLILFGNDEGTSEIAAELNLEHVPDVATSEHGTPLVQDVFDQARKMSDSPLLCYINSDIVLMSEFMKSITIASESKKEFLACGRRWNLDITEPLEFSDGWESRLRERVKSFGILEEAWAIDYFVFTPNIGKGMPPFIIGRPAWDNWFLYSALNSGYPLINATESITVVHQNHDYRHVPQGTGKSYHGPEAESNIKLAGNLASEISLRDATHVLAEGKVKLALDKDTIIRKLDMVPRIKPWTTPFVALIRFFLRITKPFRSLLTTQK